MLIFIFPPGGAAKNVCTKTQLLFEAATYGLKESLSNFG
jgi:hypothetical protein